MLKKIIYLIIFVHVSCFNISNLNDFAKQNFITKGSKLLGAYSLSYLNKTNDPKNIQENHESHTLENTLYFYSPVEAETSLLLEQKLLALNHHNINLLEKYNIDKSPIHLHIQSFGGSLFHTLYLVDLIKSIETPVYTYVDGFAASAATLLSISGKKRFMSKNSLMLIHQLSGGNAGKYAEMKDENENLDVLMDFIVNHYLENTQISREELMQLLKRDLWLNSSTCLKYGLVDKVL